MNFVVPATTPPATFSVGVRCGGANVEFRPRSRSRAHRWSLSLEVPASARAVFLFDHPKEVRAHTPNSRRHESHNQEPEVLTMARSPHRPGVEIARRTQRNTLRHSFGHGCRDVHRNQAIRPAATATTPIAIADTTQLDSANSTVRTVRLPRGGYPSPRTPVRTTTNATTRTAITPVSERLLAWEVPAIRPSGSVSPTRSSGDVGHARDSR